jgi:alpha-glucosidase
MIYKFIAASFACMSVLLSLQAQVKTFKVQSPDKSLQVNVEVGPQLTWSVSRGSQVIMAKSPIALKLSGGEALGENAKVESAKTESFNSKITALHYKKSMIEDSYGQLTLMFKKNYGVIFRAYDDGVAYRFIVNRKDSLTVESEIANFNFTDDHTAFVPYVNDPHNNDVFQTSFENNYQNLKISAVKKDTLMFAPVLVTLPEGVKVGITEADLEEYAGMFLQAHDKGFHGVFARYPLEEIKGGHNNLQSYVVKRAGYIAKTSGKRSLPWRVVIISKNDKDLLNNDMVYKLASPSRVNDVSWIKPGKVAWDWWNDWNISGVDFKAGINTQTYKYYIDFAAQYKIENILLDEGWATSEDIMKVVPEIDLQEIINYAASKQVRVWLWGGWLPLDKQMDHALSTYAKMGVKGFKIDFMDRDDQKVVQFYYRMAKKAAQYKLMLDFHGAYKPTGLQRTYPNILTFEGVRGLENVKWSNTDFPRYDCEIPFIRMLAGPMDYTPGAMKNANKDNFRSIHSSPMSQGTRCHQLALYVIFESPFAMLADNPTNYLKEKECTKFIASIPTIFDETVALDGKVGEYAAIARKNNGTWYVGAITNWTQRDLFLDLSFLKSGSFEIEFFSDGINADRDGTDFKRTVKKVTSTDKMSIHLSPGGGWAARITPADSK